MARIVNFKFTRGADLANKQCTNTKPYTPFGNRFNQGK